MVGRIVAAVALAVGWAVWVPAAEPLPWPRAGVPASVEEMVAHLAAWEVDPATQHRVLTRLAWILAAHHDPQIRDPEEAARMVARTRGEATRGDWLWWEALAASCAASERFAEAVSAQREALRLASLRDDGRWPIVQQRLALYQGRTSCRDVSLPAAMAYGASPPAAVRLAYLTCQMGEALVATGRKAAAAEAFRLALAIDSSCRAAMLRLAGAAWGRREIAQAADWYQQALHVDRRDPATLVNLATILKARGEVPRAVELYREAARLRPDWPVAANSLAWLLATHEGRPEDAREALHWAQRIAAQRHGADVEFQDTLAAAQAANGDFAQAAQTIERVVQNLSTDDPRWWRFQSRLHWYRAQRPLRARREPYLALAGHLWSQGRLDDAAECYRALLRVEEDAECLLNCLGSAGIGM